MNRAKQLQLAGMTLKEFRQWYKEAANADSLPAFHNSRWLAEQPDPAVEVYSSIKRWVERYPYPNHN